MDLPPPTEIQVKQMIPDTIEEISVDEYFQHHLFNRMDGADIPDNVKEFAKDNNCIHVIKLYYWSDKKYQGGDVYSCGINGKLKFILSKEDKLRFANWYQTRKLNIPIYEF